MLFRSLAVGVTDSPDPVTAGSTLTYTIGVTNRAGTPGTGVMVTNVLPATMNFLSASSSVGTVNRAGNLVIASLGTLAGGASASITIQVAPQAAVSHTNNVTATANEPALNGPTASASVATLVNGFTLTGIPTPSNVRVNGFSLTIAGQPGHTYVLQLSTNLVTWLSISTNGPVAGRSVNFTDPGATNSPRGFYRVIEP